VEQDSDENETFDEVTVPAKPITDELINKLATKILLLSIGTKNLHFNFR
jgi:hypothetical protein